MKNIFVEEILPLLEEGYKIFGSKNFYFNNIKPAESVNEQSLDWVNPLKKKKLEYILKSKAKIIICDDSIDIDENVVGDRCIILVKNPKYNVLKILSKFFVEEIKYQIHPSAIIHPDARIAKNCSIGAFTYIGNCEVKEGTIIDGNCYIYDNVVIGKNVKIKAGVIIGGGGFGYVRNTEGHFEKFPQIGGVIIEDDVEIGSNSCIDRGALGNTIIGEGTKIDNLVQIAHNVVVGKHTAITANSTIAGSTVIGDCTWVAPSATFLDQISIGENVTVGIGSVVTKNIPDNETWIGSPAMKFHDYLVLKRKLNKL